VTQSLQTFFKSYKVLSNYGFFGVQKRAGVWYANMRIGNIGNGNQASNSAGYWRIARLFREGNAEILLILWFIS
jgi:hypothetical protein